MGTVQQECMEDENKQKFHDLLTSFYSATRNSNSGKQSQDRTEIVLQEVLSLLGYDDQHLFNNVSVEAEDLHPIRDLQSEQTMMLCSPPDNYDPEPGITFFFDILAAKSVNSPPYLTIDTVSLTPEDFEHGADYIAVIHHLNIQRETAGAHYSILFSDEGIVVVRPSEDLEAFRFRVSSGYPPSTMRSTHRR